MAIKPITLSDMFAVCRLDENGESPLSFWAKSYLEGIRITYGEGDWHFQETLGVTRVHITKQFGEFGKLDPVEPTSEILAGIKRYKDSLIAYLSQRPPERYSPFFFHPLVNDHEALVVMRQAQRDNYEISDIVCPGGRALMYYGKPKEKLVQNPLPTLPPVLINHGYRPLQI